MLNELQQKFFDRFGEVSSGDGQRTGAGKTAENSDLSLRCFYAPGRVNLIGEHTDYNGGLVFPCGVNVGNHLMIRRRNDKLIGLASANFEFATELTPEQAQYKIDEEWVNYPLGVISEFNHAGFPLAGFDCFYSGNVPASSGLSSSAAIEVVTAFALNALFQCGIELVELVRMCQRAENKFVGVNCGIMDQFAVAMALEDHAIALDCNTLEYQQVPLNLQDCTLVLANTNQQRELSDSKYNERVAECDQALTLLQQHHDVKSLASLQPQHLQDSASLFTPSSDTAGAAAIDTEANTNVLFRRARHVIDENHRVHTAIESLQQGNLQHFGVLMNQSHDSLRDDYEVSSPQLDTLVAEARTIEGVLGSRLTGAGFGGCTINLMRNNVVEHFCHQVGTAYHASTGLSADFYSIVPAGGVHEVTL